MKPTAVTKNNAILIASYPTMSTGVNIKRIHNIIFASPLKSYVAITQSIGRGIRLHPEKSVLNVYDLVDDFATFRKQLAHRIETSYTPEGFPRFHKEMHI